MIRFRDDFNGHDLDPEVWLPHYLPAWSSRAHTRATYRVADSRLVLSIPADQRLWCPTEHPEPLRVSGIQSGNFSGPVGSSRGQQRFREGLVVREQQPVLRGWLPTPGKIEICCRMSLPSRSMAAMWLSGFEEEPEQAGEICVVEIFGKSIDGRSAEVGIGIKKLNDPNLTDQFASPRIDIDVTEDHVYAVAWNRARAVFSVDGEEIHTAVDPPTYPMQVMLAVFDFPSGSGRPVVHTPHFEIDWVAETEAGSK